MVYWLCILDYAKAIDNPDYKGELKYLPQDKNSRRQTSISVHNED